MSWRDILEISERIKCPKPKNKDAEDRSPDGQVSRKQGSYSKTPSGIFRESIESYKDNGLEGCRECFEAKERALRQQMSDAKAKVGKGFSKSFRTKEKMRNPSGNQSGFCIADLNRSDPDSFLRYWIKVYASG